MPDQDGYPTSEELLYFETYELGKTDLLEYLRRLIEAWWMPSWGIEARKEPVFPEMKTSFGECIRLYISTGGWSGNEDIILAIQKTDFFLYFQEEWRRGGHYILEFGLPEHEELLPLLKNEWRPSEESIEKRLKEIKKWVSSKKSGNKQNNQQN